MVIAMKQDYKSSKVIIIKNKQNYMSKSHQQLQFKQTKSPLSNFSTVYTARNQNSGSNNNSSLNNYKQDSKSSGINNANHSKARSRKFIKYTDPQPLLQRAKQLYQMGQLKQALFYFQESISICKGNASSAMTTEYNSSKNGLEQSLYFAAQICMAITQFEKAIPYFTQLIQLQTEQNIKSNALLLISICYNKMGKSKQTFNYLNQLCDDLKSTDGLFYRGKLRLKNQEYQEAVADFTKLIQELKFSAIPARICLIEAKLYKRSSSQAQKKKQCQILLGQIQKIQVQIADNAKKQKLQQKNKSKDSQMLKKLRNLKAQNLLILGRFKQAGEQIQRNLGMSQPDNQLNKRDSQTLFIKSKICAGENKYDEQILLLNECITVKDHRRSVTQALETLVISAMKHKDFYQAFQYSKRNNYLKIVNKSTVALFKIAEAITFLMKKKYGQALLLIGATNPQVYSNLGFQSHYIKNLHYSALGYAYFSLGEHKDSLAMYQKIQIVPQQKQQAVYLYNKRLCQGILAYQQGKTEQSIKIFQSCTDHIMRAQPYFYISVIFIQKSLAGNTDPDLITKVIQIIDSGLKVGENYQMYYYRGLLYFYLGMNAQALDDVDKAVQKSQQNIAKFFYFRGLIFFQQRNYQNAISQFTTCLSIDDKYFDAYLQRAKIKLLTDQNQQAYNDLSNHPLFDEWKPLFLLYQRDFNSVIEEKNADESIRETAFFQLGRFEDAGPAGKVVIAVIDQNYEEVMNLLQDAIDIRFQIGCLALDDLYLIKSYCCFKIGLAQQAIEMLQKSQQMLKRNQTCLLYGEEDQKKLLAIKVNAIFVYISNNQLEKSRQLCLSLINDVYEGTVYDELNKVKDHIQKLTKGEQIQTKIQLFIGSSLISDYFLQQNYKGLKFKFLVPFPKVRVLQLENVPFQQPLLQFTIKQIDNRAQAPWMQKDENGVIFTNKIEIFEHLKLYTETEQNHGDAVIGKTSKQRMKQELQLDAQVLDKLQKLSKNKKNTKSTHAT